MGLRRVSSRTHPSEGVGYLQPTKIGQIKFSGKVLRETREQINTSQKKTSQSLKTRVGR